MSDNRNARRRHGAAAGTVMRSHRNLRLEAAGAALTLLLAAPQADAADVYKCRDARGKVTYSDQPCGAKRAETPPVATPPATLDVAQAAMQPVFLARLRELARHGQLADVAFVEQQLAVRFVRRDGEGGSAYLLAPDSTLRAIEIDYLVEKPRPADGLRKSALALRVDRAMACIRPDAVTAVFGDVFREFDFGPDARPDVASKLRRIIYEFAAAPGAPLALTVTFERRQEFCVDLLNFDQVDR